MIKLDFHSNKNLGIGHSSSRVFVIAMSSIVWLISINIGHAQEPTTAPLNIKYAFVDHQNENLKENYEFELYFYEVLKLALNKSNVNHRLQALITNGMVNERKNKLLQSGDLDVYWNTTNKHFEDELLAVRIPLLKGLIGWRLMLVHKDQAETLASVTNIKQLQKYIAGQGRDWDDTKIWNLTNLTSKVSPIKTVLWKC